MAMQTPSNAPRWRPSARPGATQGRRADAAELLGISRKTLWEKIKHLEIAVD